MKLKYMLNLYKQYCNALGKQYSETNIFTDKSFLDWIVRLKRQTKLYTEYLEECKIVLDKEVVAELEKGKYDSIGKENAKIISPYASTMDEKNSKIINFGTDIIIDNGFNLVYAENYKLFLTHNPYILENLENLALAKSKGIDVALGIYGKNYDKNKHAKIKMLSALRDFLTKDGEIHIDTLNDNYFALLKEKETLKIRKNLGK